MSQILHPQSAACRKTYRHIQAHCAIRLSTTVGNRMRAMAGVGGDITAFTAEVIRTRFQGEAEREEATRLVALANYIKSTNRRGNIETKN